MTKPAILLPLTLALLISTCGAINSPDDSSTPAANIGLFRDTEVTGNLINRGTLRVGAGQTLRVLGNLDLQGGSSLENQGALTYCGTLASADTLTDNAPQRAPLVLKVKLVGGLWTQNCAIRHPHSPNDPQGQRAFARWYAQYDRSI